MKILKEGQLPQAKAEIYRGACERCGCQVEATESELVFKDPLSSKGAIATGAAACPTVGCGQTITVRKVVMR